MTNEEFRAACNELADAMIAGCKETLPVMGDLLCFPEPVSGKPEEIRACVLGAAYFAKKPETRQGVLPKEVMDLFPVLEEKVCWNDGAKRLHPENLYEASWLLNDLFGWTREDIAEKFVRIAQQVPENDEKKKKKEEEIEEWTA